VIAGQIQRISRHRATVPAEQLLVQSHTADNRFGSGTDEVVHSLRNNRRIKIPAETNT